MVNQDRPARPLCGAKTRAEGNPPCKQRVVPGTNRCRFHGGRSPQAQRAARERETEAQLRQVVDRLDLSPVENPLEALRALAAEVIGWKDLISLHVGRLNAPKGDDGKGEGPGFRYRTENAEQIRGEVVIFERALDRCATVLTAIAKLNIDERLAAITERQVSMLESALEAGLDELGLTVEQKARAWEGAARHLKLVG